VPNVIHPFGRGGATSAEDPFQARLLALAEEIGVELAADQPGLGLGSDYLDIFPPSLQDKDFIAERPDRTLLRPVPFGLPGELPASVTGGDGRPLVYLTLGTGFAVPDVLRAAITGLSSLDARVLVAAGPAVNVADFGPLPENVETHVWVPQAQLLPHADLVVHHGGSGSTLGALASGVPQLLLPQGADHFVNAAAVTESGAGRTIVPPALSAESVAVEAKLLLAEDEHHKAAAAVAEEIAAMPSPAEVAARLPELVN
jgi:UDP:flavonoid glycosyltransferase YjiC (YdhE family)